MEGVALPVGVKADIDECFSFTREKTYQDRAHEYLERYGVSRTIGDTAMLATVNDIAERAFEAGTQAARQAPIDLDLASELLVTAARLVKCASAIEGRG